MGTNLLSPNSVAMIKKIGKDRLKRREEELNTLISLFEMLLEIPNEPLGRKHDNISFDIDYARDLNNYCDNPISYDSNEALNRIEAMLKKIVKISYPEQWESEWEKYDIEVSEGKRQKSKQPWTLIQLYERIGVFAKAKIYIDSALESGKISELDRLTFDAVIGKNGNVILDENNLKYYVDWPNYMYSYCYTYITRNESSHGINANVFAEVFTVYLDVISQYGDVIAREFAFYQTNKGMNGSSYSKRIVEEYEEKAKEYASLNWRLTLDDSQDDNMAEITSDQLYKTFTSEIVKIVGGPGIGKSEVMKYCQYLMCKKYIENKVKVLPVYIELYELAEQGISIIDYLKEQLKLNSEMLDLILQQGTILLLLDGYNEVIDLEKRKEIANEIDKKIRVGYPKLSFVISDRSKNNNPSVATYAKTLELLPLNENQISTLLSKKIEFARNYSNIPYSIDEKKFVRDFYISEESGLMDNVKWIEKSEMATAFCLEKMVDYSFYKKEVADKSFFWAKYLELLLEREINEKKDYRIDTVKVLLTRIAQNVSEGEDINRLRLIDLIKEYVDEKMDTTSANEYVRLLKQMGIFYYIDNNYKFAVPEYRDYFYNGIWMMEDM